MIRIDANWLATEPMDMRSGTEAALARVIAVFGAAKPHCAYLFANHRANRMKVLVHDCVGVWLVHRQRSVSYAKGCSRPNVPCQMVRRRFITQFPDKPEPALFDYK